ncbi:MAG: hypothetical protein QXO15_09095 [Nitrososphaerota archaeon]
MVTKTSLQITFAHVRFQEEITTSLPLENEVKNKVAFSSFPSYPSSNWPFLRGYEGLKIFSSGERICVSYFFNGGEKDRFGRPILSARVMIIPRDEFDRCCRDVIAVMNLLKNLETINAASSLYVSFLERSALTSNFEAFSNFLQNQEPKFIAKSLSLMIANKRVNIFYENIKDAYSWIRAIYLFMPIDVITKTSFVTDCERLNQVDRENYVMVPRERRVDSHLLAKILKRKLARVANINLEKRSARGKSYELIEHVILETINDEMWYGIEWYERYRILLELLNKVVTGERPSMTQISEKIRHMSKTIEKTKFLEGLAMKKKRWSLR